MPKCGMLRLVELQTNRLLPPTQYPNNLSELDHLGGFILPKKFKASNTKKISAETFSSEFNRFVSAHLAVLSPAEQDKRIRAAHRRATRSRAVSSTAREASSAPEIRRSARTREQFPGRFFK